MLLLAFESSCDDSSVAVVRDGRQVLSCLVASQYDIHAKYGGVIPELAARQHARVFLDLVSDALTQADVTWDDIDAIAVTYGPGLLASLQTAVDTAKILASQKNKPLIPVHHVHGHMYSAYLDTDFQPEFPYLVMTASGGHNELVLVQSHSQRMILGMTRDDAAGEAFDKIAKIMWLPYPGGVEVSKLADEYIAEINSRDVSAETSLLQKPETSLLQVQDKLRNYDFSFSGFKTAFKRVWDGLSHEEKESKKSQLACEAQTWIVSAIVSRVAKAKEEYGISSIHMVGGVSANRHLQSQLQVLDIELHRPVKSLYSTDNAAMIAAAAYFQEDGKVLNTPDEIWTLMPQPNILV